ncbi:SCP2 sterol-binding domain-containing protein [Kalaharituber pfeilii]|nr:SCP2 sterol-binding domain-containing protein [Kalaharituber pfeilii]
MPLANPSFPSSVAFDAIAAALSTEASRTSALKSGGKAIFEFKLNNGSGTSSWYIDLKTTGTVGAGSAPEGQKPDVTLEFKDEDFGKLVKGEVQAQKLFMGGKMKVRGDLMKATKAETVLKGARQYMESPKAKL